MPHLAKWTVAIALLLSLLGCQQYRPAMISEEISLAKPKQGRYSEQQTPGSCTYFPTCDVATVFPNHRFRGAPEGAECVLPAAIEVGQVLFPRDVVIGQPRSVWVAVVVSATGDVDDAKVIGSTDARFDGAAYKVAKSTRFRPTTCGSTAYESFVIYPFVFSPPRASTSTARVIDAQLLYDNNELYPNDRQLP
ncbi:MAG: TonB family protein [Pseudomonas sp.]